MHQEREYPGRVSGTDLVNPDFAALARAYGWHAARVEKTAEFAPAFERALAAGEPTLLHLRLSPDVSTSRTTLTAIATAPSSASADRPLAGPQHVGMTSCRGDSRRLGRDVALPRGGATFDTGWHEFTPPDGHRP